MDADKKTDGESRPRTREFLRVERERAANPASKALHRKPRAPRGGEVRHFVRIERGQEV